MLVRQYGVDTYKMSDLKMLAIEAYSIQYWVDT